MTWSLNALPAAEGLAAGLRPAPAAERGETRRVFVTLFAALGLIAGIQNALDDEPAAGQRRIAEVNLAERKGECRACAPILARSDSDGGET